MKKVIFFIFLISSFYSFSQSETEVARLLTEKFQIKDSISGGNIWVYNEDKIRKFEIPLISSKLHLIEFYKTNFMFIGDLESWSEDCIVMFDKKTNEIIMLPNHSIKEDFYKKFIGIRFKNKSEIKKFAKEFSLILLNKNFYDEIFYFLKEIIIEEDLITFETRLEHQKKSHEKIDLHLNKKEIVEIISLNPKRNNAVEISIK